MNNNNSWQTAEITRIQCDGFKLSVLADHNSRLEWETRNPGRSWNDYLNCLPDAIPNDCGILLVLKTPESDLEPPSYVLPRRAGSTETPIEPTKTPRDLKTMAADLKAYLSRIDNPDHLRLVQNVIYFIDRGWKITDAQEKAFFINHNKYVLGYDKYYKK